MTVKLLTISDSISQGFMSFAAARTDLAYSTLIAEKLGLSPRAGEYLYPEWAAGGLPLNLEYVLRELYDKYGDDISGLEWLSIVQLLEAAIDEVEQYYERGDGGVDKEMRDANGNKTDFFHNISVQGSKVADAWLVTPALCKQILQSIPPVDNSILRFWEGSSSWLPDRSYYRIALKVLNPSLNPQYDGYHALRWLEKHAVEDDGVENLIISLGGNNALSTVITLKINQTENNPHMRPHTLSRREREEVWQWNLWHPDDFKAEYRELMKQVVTIMKDNKYPDWKVFVANIPMITIAPIIRGYGDSEDMNGLGHYFETYTWFLRSKRPELGTRGQLTRESALWIDNTIREYNKFIGQHLEELNNELGIVHFYLVDLADALNKLAFKRNAGNVRYVFPEYFNTINPRVDTKYYYVNRNKEMEDGGIFSLDGIHPSAIGHGLIAWEFLKVMEKVGLVPDTDLPWDKIFKGDTLYSDPIPLIQEIYDHPFLVEILLKLYGLT